ncbi:MAG: nitroreductase [Alphaproteobacteria bacterium]|nr:nitroreductase [Alphaproteobacteria bacterium]
MIIPFLKTRRSSKITSLTSPGPNAEQLQDLLTIGARVPDHGKYHPWYFIVFEGNARREAGDLLRQAYAAENPDAAPAKLDLEAENFLRAPLVIAVVSRIREGKTPEWEQILSAGATCYNICLAANAMGFGSNWLTQWYSYSPTFRQLMGLETQDRFAGFIYIGTATTPNEDRERPDLSRIVTRWTKKSPALNTGGGK